MNDLDRMLGDIALEECLEDIVMGFDGKPRQARQNPELGKLSLGRLVAGVATGGVSELARSRVGRAVMTGGVSEAARAAKKAITGKKPTVKLAASAKGAVDSIAKTALAGVTKPLAAAIPKISAPVVSAALPEIRIRVMPCCDGQGGQSAAVAKDLAKKITPEMTRIRSVLDQMQLQNKVTSEHNAIKKRNKFQTAVLGRLASIQAKRAGCNFQG